MEALKREMEQRGYEILGPITKGWSSDKKFLMSDREGGRLVLRAAAIERLEQKRQEFAFLSRVAALGVPTSQPVCFGVCADWVYMVLRWVDGEDMEQVLLQQSLSDEEQYQLGVQASRLLKQIHALPLSQEQQKQQLTGKRMEHKLMQLKRYEESGVRMPQDRRLIEEIRKKSRALSCRPAAWCHGDFHAGNLVYTPQRSVAVIDFNRFDLIDPYEEFYKVELFDTEVSVPFAAGRLDGYFGTKVPTEFWQVHRIYLMQAILYSIVWAQPFGPEEVDGMTSRYLRAMQQYGGFEREIPLWYERYKNR